jgi:hypothetical protein
MPPGEPGTRLQGRRGRPSPSPPWPPGPTLLLAGQWPSIWEAFTARAGVRDSSDALAATGQVPEEIRPALRGFVSSALRLLDDSPLSGQGHPDEELRTVARQLLATG